MSKQKYTLEVTFPDDKTVYQRSYNEAVFVILKSICTENQIDFILRQLKGERGGKIESSNLYSKK